MRAKTTKARYMTSSLPYRVNTRLKSLRRRKVSQLRYAFCTVPCHSPKASSDGNWGYYREIPRLTAKLLHGVAFVGCIHNNAALSIRRAKSGGVARDLRFCSGSGAATCVAAKAARVPPRQGQHVSTGRHACAFGRRSRAKAPPRATLLPLLAPPCRIAMRRGSSLKARRARASGCRGCFPTQRYSQ